VKGKSIAPGVTLTVHVFGARDGKGKKGPKGPPSSGGGDVCSDDADQNQAPQPFAGASSSPMQFLIDNSFAPSAVAGTAESALGRSFSTWDAEIPGAYFGMTPAESAPNSPRQDGMNVVGWARLVPKSTLAAAWTYTDDQTGRVIEADVFFNTAHPWGVASSCTSPSYDPLVFDLENVGTHEIGHVLGLEHVSDSAKQATMYPSAPRGELRKQTLTSGDKAGLAAAFQ
jgi:hypothetical protein